MYKYAFNCVSPPNVDDLVDMVDNAIDITYRTFIKHVDWRELARIFDYYEWANGKGLRLKDDWAVTFHRSKYGKHRVYYVCHSSIEYIFMKGD